MRAEIARYRLLQPVSLVDAMRSMAMREKRLVLKLALPQEMPFRMGYMDAAAPESLAGP